MIAPREDVSWATMAPAMRPPTISQIAMRFLLAIAAGSVGRATKGRLSPGRSVEGNRLQEATSAIAAIDVCPRSVRDRNTGTSRAVKPWCWGSKRTECGRDRLEAELEQEGLV
jgi:hypothetical protein